MTRRALLVLLALASVACDRGPRPAEEPVSRADVSADSLFRAGHARLRDGEPTEAARSFASVRTKGDADLAVAGTYWEAFALARVGDPRSLGRARELLAGLLLSHPDSPLAADATELELRILGLMAGHDAAGVDRALDADSLLAACHASDPYAPALALSGLVRSNPERGVAALERALTGGTCPPAARHNALYVVPLAAGEAGAALLARVARTDPDDSVRLDAAIALQRFASRGGTDRLLALWDVAGTRAMKEQLILQYAALDDPAGEAKLREIVEEDPERSIRIFARLALGARKTTLIDRFLPL